MAPNNQNTGVEHQESIQESQNKLSKTKLGLAALAMSAIVSGTQAKTSDLLAQCDLNHNGIIDGRISLKDLKKQLKSDGDYSDKDKEKFQIALANTKKERDCKKKIDKQEIAQIKQETAQIKQETAQKKVYLAQLDMSIKNLKEELRKVEAELSKSEAELSKSEAELSKSEAELSKSEAELSKSEAELSKSEAELNRKRKEREKKRIWIVKQIEKIQNQK